MGQSQRTWSKIDLTGKKIGLLMVLSEEGQRNKNGEILYKVQCECGKIAVKLGALLKSGKTKSCGRCKLLIGKHLLSSSRENRIWRLMKDRCLNEKSTSYKNYGGRGITICERWINSFTNFYADLGESNGLTLDRINTHGNYEPSNCRWASTTTQARNKTNNKLINYKGETKCLSEWCEILGVHVGTMWNRINNGWSIERCFQTPVVKRRTL